MKSLYLLAATVLVASCARDLPAGTDQTGQEPALRFNLALGGKPKVQITRADIASDFEKQLDSVAVWIFDTESKALIASPDDFTASKAEGKYILTAARANWLKQNVGKSARAYFVGNPQSGGGTLENFAGDEDAFTATLSDPLPPSQCPLLSSGSLDFTMPNASTPLFSGNVQLTRRQARFDVVNTQPDKLTLTRVIVKNAPNQGGLFTRKGVGKLTFEARLSDATFTAPDFLAASVFYLYPAQLGTNPYDLTSITVMGRIQGGDEVPLPVNSTVAIDPNKRYKLILNESNISLDPTDLSFRVELAEYDEGADLPFEQNKYLIPSGYTFPANISALTPADQNPASWANRTFTVKDDGTSTETATMDISLFAASEQGVRIEQEDLTGLVFQRGLVHLEGGYPKTESKITREGAGYRTIIRLLIKFPFDAPFSTVIRYTDRYNDAKGSLTLNGARNVAEH